MSNSFTPVAWSYQANIYEINLRQYTAEGTFNAFSKHLPRLRDMGIEILWFMPITPISAEKRKGTLGSYYAASDYTDTNPEFGTVPEFTALVKYAHELGFKVIIDWVANHTGWDHRWTKEHPDYFLHNGNGNFTERNGWDDVIDLDYNNRAMRNAMIGSMRFWIEACNIDGFRCDMAHLVTLDFWIEARTALDPLKDLFWLAECEDPRYHAAFDATYTWDWMHKTEAYCRGHAGLDDLWNQLYNYHFNFPANAFRLYFTSNHDENSWNGTEYEKFGPRAKNLAVFSATWNGMPLIYSGQELPNNKRLKFFDKDPIEWTEQVTLHAFYQTLLALRKQNPALRAGDNDCSTYRVRTNEDGRVLAYLRKNGNHEVLVLLNFSGEEISLRINDPVVKGKYSDVFLGTFTEFTGDTSIQLPAWGCMVGEKG